MKLHLREGAFEFYCYCVATKSVLGDYMNLIDFMTVDRVTKIYNEKVLYTDSVGVDKINNYEFRKNLGRNIKKIISDIKDNKYVFKPYKIVLIPKNIDTKPRKVCVPTIRDRLTIEIIKEYLFYRYEGYSLNYGISNLVDDFVKDYNCGKYKKYLKADLSTYFDTINHKKMLKKLEYKINDDLALHMISNILSNSQKFKDNVIETNLRGVPQGLSISMALANIYMMDIDACFKDNKNLRYYRYVDDVFIFCNKYICLQYFKFKRMLKRNKLILNKEKTKISIINHPFEFLGYSLNDKVVTVRKPSIDKLINSIVRIFKNYKINQNRDELIWRLNIRVSGAICNNKKYGWMFYFSKINDMKLLYHLDKVIEKLKIRYKLEDIDTKSFVKTYYAMKMKELKNNPYFFNADKVGDAEKRVILGHITKFSTEEINNLSSHDLEYNYRKAIFKCLKSLEKDLDRIS